MTPVAQIHGFPTFWVIFGPDLVHTPALFSSEYYRYSLSPYVFRVSQCVALSGECLTLLVLTLGQLKEPSVQSDYWGLMRVLNVRGNCRNLLGFPISRRPLPHHSAETVKGLFSYSGVSERGVRDPPSYAPQGPPQVGVSQDYVGNLLRVSQLKLPSRSFRPILPVVILYFTYTPPPP